MTLIRTEGGLDGETDCYRCAEPIYGEATTMTLASTFAEINAGAEVRRFHNSCWDAEWEDMEREARGH